jgi:hypothetical protein
MPDTEGAGTVRGVAGISCGTAARKNPGVERAFYYVSPVPETECAAEKPDTFSFERAAIWVHPGRNLWEA